MPKVETVFGAVISISLFAAGSAFAGVGGSVTPTYPAGPVRVGDTFTASLTIVNDSDGANHAERIAVSNISHTRRPARPPIPVFSRFPRAPVQRFPPALASRSM